MRKLLSANFSRLRKDEFFWLCIVFMLGYSVVYMLNGCRQASMDMAEYHYSIDKYYFHFALSIGFFCAIFGSLFFGTEYRDATLRTKIIAGHRRTDIYMSSLITTFAVTLLIMLTWLLGALIALPVLGVWKMGVNNLLLYLLIAVLSAAAYSSIFTVVNMVSGNESVTIIFSMLLMTGLLIFASILYNRLGEPEVTSGVLITVDGMEMAEPTPNPNYVGGVKREIYDFIIDFLPTGQGIRMWQLEISHPVRMLASSAVITLLTTLAGMAAFRKKDIK